MAFFVLLLHGDANRIGCIGEDFRYHSAITFLLAKETPATSGAPLHSFARADSDSRRGYFARFRCSLRILWRGRYYPLYNTHESRRDIAPALYFLRYGAMV